MSREMVNPRNSYGETLVELGKKHSNLVVLDADLSKSTKTIMFAKKYPERFFEMGIAEANMISTAAGLASCGKIPFVSPLPCLQQVECMIRSAWMLPIQMPM
jgi:transketolase